MNEDEHDRNTLKKQELWKRNCNSDGQSFHQYLQNKESLLTRTCNIENQVLVWDRHKNV